jgi:hypothetical protein
MSVLQKGTEGSNPSVSASFPIFVLAFNNLIFTNPSTHTRTHILFMNKTQLCPPNAQFDRSVSMCFEVGEAVDF